MRGGRRGVFAAPHPTKTKHPTKEGKPRPTQAPTQQKKTNKKKKNECSRSLRLASNQYAAEVHPGS